MTAFQETIADRTQLRQRYRQPSEPVQRKEIDHIDEGARDLIAASPFVVVATRGAGGADASPRGGPPGFVAVLDEHRLAMGDLSGNNRLDSFTNVLDDPSIGLLFFLPGLDETLRVNGRGCLTTDPEVLDAAAIDGRVPKVALGVEVEACFIHCAKAFRRARLWEPDSWLDTDEVPSPAGVLGAHLELDVAAEVIEADLEEGYEVTMWEPAGDS